MPVGSAPDMDALNRHPLPYGPGENFVRKIMQFCSFLQLQELYIIHVHTAHA